MPCPYSRLVSGDLPVIDGEISYCAFQVFPPSCVE